MSDLHRWASFEAALQGKVISHCDKCGHLTLFDHNGICQKCMPKFEDPEWEEWFKQ